MYLEYWKNTFNYKGQSKLGDLIINLFINFVILFFIFLLGYFLVPFQWERTLGTIFEVVQLVMILPTVSMIIRIVNRYKYKR